MATHITKGTTQSSGQSEAGCHFACELPGERSLTAWLSLHVTDMADFWGMRFFLGLEDDDIFYPILGIMLIVSLFVFIMALWKWKVGVRAGAEPGAATHGGGSVGSGPSAGLGWGPCLGGEAVTQRGLARLGQESRGRHGPGPGCALGCWVLLRMLPSRLLFSLPIQKERQRKCQRGGNQENSRGAPHPLTLSPLPTVCDFHTSSQHVRMQ